MWVRIQETLCIMDKLLQGSFEESDTLLILKVRNSILLYFMLLGTDIAAQTLQTVNRPCSYGISNTSFKYYPDPHIPGGLCHG